MGAKIGGWIFSIIGALISLTGILALIGLTMDLGAEIEQYQGDTATVIASFVILFIGLGLLAVGIIWLFKAHQRTVEKRNTDKLFELKRMLDEGIITENEFNDRKAQLLEVKNRKF